jgi:hypothetical protein
VIAIAAPEPTAGIGVLKKSTASTPVIVTGVLVLAVPAAMAKVAWATDPFPITVVFSPNTTHIVAPATLEQDTLLPAANAAASATTVIPVMSEGE